MNTVKKLWIVRSNERGFALPLVMLIGLTMLVMGLAFLEMSRQDVTASMRNLQEVQSLAAAEIGIARASAMAQSQKIPWTNMTLNGSQLSFQVSADPLYNGNPICTLWADVPAGDNSNATYSVVIENLGSFLPVSGVYRIHAFGVSGNDIRHVTIEATTVTYASFSWLTNYERGENGNRIYFADGDVVDGWVYSNDQFNIADDPVFKGKVNSAADSLYYCSGGPPNDNPDFQEGLLLDSPEIDIQAMLNNGHIETIRDYAQEATGIYLGPNDGLPYRISFNPNGTVTIHKLEEKTTGRGRWKRTTYEWEAVYTNKPISSTNGAIYCEEEVEISGTLEGQVTVATPEGTDMIITGDLVYSYPSNKKAVFDEDWDPTDPNFTSKLGLISGGDIVLDENDLADLYVMGSFASVSGSFRNENYERPPLKTLHLYGGITQDRRGPIGTFGGRWDTGYTKDYKYDERFFTAPPPYYDPLTYDLSGWSMSTPE